MISEHYRKRYLTDSFFYAMTNTFEVLMLEKRMSREDIYVALEIAEDKVKQELKKRRSIQEECERISDE